VRLGLDSGSLDELAEYPTTSGRCVSLIFDGGEKSLSVVFVSCGADSRAAHGGPEDCPNNGGLQLVAVDTQMISIHTEHHVW
jgi:hypothetical protein